MGSEWREKTLGSILTGGIRHGLYKPAELFGSGTRVLKMGIQYSEDRIGPQEMDRVPLNDDELNKFLVHKGDLLFSRTSMISDGAGKCSIVIAHQEPFVFDGNILCGTPDTKLVNSAFLYYFFKSTNGKRAIQEIIAGTQARSLSGTNLAKVVVPIPPLPEQRAIAHVLGTLDDKIELNRKTNETLDAMARALFKSWFVDFEPVRAKAEGRPTGLPEEIDKLFPDSFEDSELGEVPKGWSVTEYHNIFEFSKGKKPFQTFDSPADNLAPLILIETLNTGATVYASIENMVTSTIYDSLMVMDGASSGRVEVGCAGIVGSTLAKISPKRLRPGPYYVHYALKLLEPEIRQHLTGTSIPHTDKGWIIRQLTTIPDNDLLMDKFEETVKIMQQNVKIHSSQSRTLASIRDALLPKLISGDVRIPDVEGFLRERGIET